MLIASVKRICVKRKRDMVLQVKTCHFIDPMKFQDSNTPEYKLTSRCLEMVQWDPFCSLLILFVYFRERCWGWSRWVNLPQACLDSYLWLTKLTELTQTQGGWGMWRIVNKPWLWWWDKGTAKGQYGRDLTRFFLRKQNKNKYTERRGRGLCRCLILPQLWQRTCTHLPALSV